MERVISKDDDWDLIIHKMTKTTKNGVTIEVIRISGLKSVLARIGNSMMYGDRMPVSWRRSVLIPLYKGKGDTKECSNYRSLKMLEYAIKILERVFERSIRSTITISDIQMDSCLEKAQLTPYFL